MKIKQQWLINSQILAKTANGEYYMGGRTFTKISESEALELIGEQVQSLNPFKKNHLINDLLYVIDQEINKEDLSFILNQYGIENNLKDSHTPEELKTLLQAAEDKILLKVMKDRGISISQYQKEH